MPVPHKIPKQVIFVLSSRALAQSSRNDNTVETGMNHEIHVDQVIARRNGFALASFLIGAMSLLTLRIFLPGAMASIALGAYALYLAYKKPEEYGGKKFAYVGIAAGAVSIVLPILLLLFVFRRPTN